MIGFVALMHLFLAIVPVYGLFFGLIPWYIVPIYYILIHSTGLAKASLIVRIVVICILTAFFVGFIILASVLPLGSIIG